MEKVWTVKLENGASFEVRGAEELALKKGDLCVFRRDFYEELKAGKDNATCIVAKVKTMK